MGRPRARGLLAVDLQALQSATTRSRGIGRYAADWAQALEAVDSDLVDAYVLNPTLPPPGGLDTLVATGKLVWAPDVDLDRLALWHAASLFDLATTACSLSPARLIERGIALSVTVYDLIPALDPDQELPDPADRRRYRTRLELVRDADLLLALSHAVAGQLANLAGVAPHRIAVIGGAPDARFTPPADRAVASEAARALLAGVGLARPYVLASSGSHPRKNNERLIAGFLGLEPGVRERYQLVITGELDAPTANHYRALASMAGAEGSVVVTGHVDDATLLALTQGAALCCMASLTEGFGLPIVEAQACGTPVICSDRPPFDELVPPQGRFDPEVPAALGALLEAALTDEPLRARLAAAGERRWADVARASASALHERLAHPPRWGGRRPAGRRRRTRLAMLTPLPPAPSGVAGYDFALADALVRTEKVELTLFAEERTAETVAPDGCSLFAVESFGKVEALEGRFDHVVYALGNSHHHLGALRWLGVRSGVVLAHDVRLTNLYRHAHGEPWRRPGGFARALAAMYPAGLPEDLGSRGELTVEEIEQFGALMAREVIRSCQAFVVTSSSARALAAVDAGPGLSGRLHEVPFAFFGAEAPVASYVEEPRPAPAGLGPELGARWGALEARPGRTVLAHFGIVDPAKCPDLLLRAAAELGPAAPIELAFVGPIADELSGRLAALAAELGLLDRLTITGPLEPASYRRWLAAADIAIQLRASSNGEASATVGECLGAGVATVVSDLGWAGELPDRVVAKLSPSATPGELATLLGALCADDSRRRALGDAGRAHASSATFDRSARALLALLESIDAMGLAATT